MEPSNSPRRVLVVDTYPSIAEVLALLIASWGHETWAARTAHEARVLTAAVQPDVILMDTTLPALLAWTLRDLASPVLILGNTTQASDHDPDWCAAAGITVCLRKPHVCTEARAFLSAGDLRGAVPLVAS
jgi:CheY-like chemotaxis protein